MRKKMGRRIHNREKDGVEVLCSHQIKFAKADYSGQEIWEYYRSGESRPYETTSRTHTLSKYFISPAP